MGERVGNQLIPQNIVADRFVATDGQTQFTLVNGASSDPTSAPLTNVN